jgi:myo-inositol 2-dehydrogenase / D-chiro-inositol 1-dehydrogenase
MGKGKLYPEFKSDISDLEKKLATLPEPEPQVTDFVEAVKLRKKFALNEMNGHRSCTIINIGKIAMQLNRSLKFDPVKQLFIDDAEANTYIEQPMRGDWKI